MRDVLNLTFSSSLTEMCEVNQSFDTGILRVCYTGKNRNGSFISKETLERGLKTIANCPVVCHYDRDNDEFGGHDMELAHDADGKMRLVNLTQPVGVIPESAKQWFGSFKDENGVEHEYLYTEVLLWKRQEAYRKIKEDGITSESMEITVTNGKRVDGVYHIEDFEFTAFALIGVEPCYESSALEVFSMSDFKQQMSEMMQDLKETFNLVTTPSGDDNTHPNHNSMEGGETALDEKMELVAKYGIDVDALDFSIEDFTVEELTEKFEAIVASRSEDTTTDESFKCGDDDEEDKESKCSEDEKDEDKQKCAKEDDEDEEDGDADESEPSEEDPKEDDEEDKFTNDFALASELLNGIMDALCAEKVAHEWGECPRYCYADYDAEAGEVYCWDSQDWLLYGFKFAMDGDNVVIDFESKIRKKYAIVDFDEGEQASPFADTFSVIGEKFAALADSAAKFTQASEEIVSLKAELDDLRAFKAEVDKAEADAERAGVFAQFEDLAGVEAFEALKADCEEYELDDIEEKCFAIRGRMKPVAKFSLEQKAPKFMVGFDKGVESGEPYGELFVKYHVGQ